MRSIQQNQAIRATIAIGLWLSIGFGSLGCAADVSVVQATTATTSVQTPTAATAASKYIPSASDIHTFYVAIAQNDTGRVKNYLEQGFDPNASEGKKRVAPMFWAARRGAPEGMELLLKHGGDPNLKYHNDTALLAYVIGRGASLKNPSSDWSDQDEVQQEKLNDRLNTYHNLALLLLDYGADPNSRYELDRGKYFTALGMAAEMDDLELVKRLVDLGANVHEPKNTPFAPLFQAARNANVEIAKVLLEKGGDVFARNGTEADDRSFLGYAISSRKLEFALLPLSYGAMLKDYEQRMFGGSAEKAGYYHELLAALLEKGMDVHDSRPYPPVKGRNLANLKLLIEAGAPICKRNIDDGKTVYEDALTYGTSQDVLDYLKAQGGDRCPPANN